MDSQRFASSSFSTASLRAAPHARLRFRLRGFTAGRTLFVEPLPLEARGLGGHAGLFLAPLPHLLRLGAGRPEALPLPFRLLALAVAFEVHAPGLFRVLHEATQVILGACYGVL